MGQSTPGCLGGRPSLPTPCRKRGSRREVYAKRALAVPTASAMSKAAAHAMAEAAAYVVAAGNTHTHTVGEAAAHAVAEAATAEMGDTYAVETHAVMDDRPVGAHANVAEAVVLAIGTGGPLRDIGDH